MKKLYGVKGFKKMSHSRWACVHYRLIKIIIKVEFFKKQQFIVLLFAKFITTCPTFFRKICKSITLYLFLNVLNIFLIYFQDIYRKIGKILKSCRKFLQKNNFKKFYTFFVYWNEEWSLWLAVYNWLGKRGTKEKEVNPKVGVSPYHILLHFPQLLQFYHRTDTGGRRVNGCLSLLSVTAERLYKRVLYQDRCSEQFTKFYFSSNWKDFFIFKNNVKLF